MPDSLTDAQERAAESIRARLGSKRLWLAPMAGVSEPVFRVLCLEQGAGLAFTEMISAKGLEYENPNTDALLRLGDGESEVAVQLFGDEPEPIARQAAILSERMGDTLALIDINMGCPVGKVVKKGAGAALMKDPDRAVRIISACCAATDRPVTAKFRRGFKMGDDTCEAFARSLRGAGAAAIAVHGRYAEQYYGGRSDPDAIARVKQAVDIPVIASGDLTTPEAVRDTLERTRADGAMLARGARGNPWLFPRAYALLSGDAEAAALLPTIDERVAMARRHTRGLAKIDGHLMLRMRQNFTAYFRSVPHASAYRSRVNTCSTLEEFEALYDEILVDARRFAETHGEEAER